MVSLQLSLSNMIQSSDYQINCKVEALNEWTSLSDPTDVSEAESFLWFGKTQHIIKNLKTNVRFILLKFSVGDQASGAPVLRCEARRV